jgi:hypothetical protein
MVVIRHHNRGSAQRARVLVTLPKKHHLQNPANKREILADDKLAKIFRRPKVTMFEMNKHLAQHLK